MADELARLAVEVERATGDPDKLREIDYRVMHATLPAGRAYLWEPKGSNHRYTTSLDAVVALIRERLPQWMWTLASQPTRFVATVWEPAEDEEAPITDGRSWAKPIDAGGATPALALLAATLSALAAQEQADADR